VITIVSGLPRSGTSLMMQMLEAGGMPTLTDGVRKADDDNPRGYFEWEKIKELPKNPGLIAEAEGKAVKVISTLLMALPMNRNYRVIFLRRPLDQVAASQARMIQRRSGSGPALEPAALTAALEAHRRSMVSWLSARTSLDVYWMDFPELVAKPWEHAHALVEFLSVGLDAGAMASVVDAALYRNR
jgi:hypothetical protein